MLLQEPIPRDYIAMSDEDLARQIKRRCAEIDGLLVLGHHYQQDDIIQHADVTGDSLKLARTAAAIAQEREVRCVIFCGVHFMAETAAMLLDESVPVILPDLSAGCSMADMADIDDAVIAWEQLLRAHGPNWNGRIIPITYINSSAAIKAFVGERGGACCTSSNARAVLKWALRGGTQPIKPGEEIKVLFLPDQHLGRNTASDLGFITEIDETAGRGRSQCVVWDPQQNNGGLSDERIPEARILLWAGYCSVHMQFRPDDVDRTRAELKAIGAENVKVIVHPECRKEVVDKADMNGSTERIIRAVENAPSGSHWAIGTEVHLVNRLAQKAAERGVHVHMLSHCPCLCASMYRINPAHLLWVLDNLADGRVVNRITVPQDVADPARLAIRRMLDLAE